MTATATKTAQRIVAAPAPQSSNAVVTASANEAPTKPQTIGESLKARSSQFQAALPAHIPLERFMRVVMTAVQKNPDLAHADRASLFTSAIQAAQDGLLPDGREGALVIYNSKVKQDGKEIWIKMVQWMPMIAGIRKKVRNSGEISTWDAHEVYELDDFEYQLGDDPFIKHKPYLDGDPGEVIAAYSIAVLKSGEKSREVMMRWQIEKVRQRSKQKDSNGNPTGPWKTDYEEMCRKTVARRHSKVLPMSTDLDDLIRRDDALYDMEGAREEAQIANGGRAQSLTSRLDVLAGAARRENAPLVEREPAAAEITHDPSTGEIQGQSATAGNEAPANGPMGASQEAGAATDQEQPDEAEAGEGLPASAADDSTKSILLEKLAAKARNGTSALRRALGGISPSENEMLTDDDHDALGDIAADADRKKGAA